MRSTTYLVVEKFSLKNNKRCKKCAFLFWRYVRIRALFLYFASFVVGSMVAFGMRLLHAELPHHLGRSQETLDRFYYILAVTQKVLVK